MYYFILPDGKLIFNNNNLYYGLNLQKISTENISIGIFTKSFDIDIKNTSTASKQTTLTQDVPIDITKILYYTAWAGYSVNATIANQYCYPKLYFTHTIYGSIYSLSGWSIVESGNLSADFGYTNNLESFIRVSSTQFINVNTDRSASTPSILDNTNKLTVTLSGEGDTYISHLKGIFNYMIYCLYIA